MKLNNRMNIIKAVLAFAALSLASPAFAHNPPSWVGATTHTWSPRLGGTMWYQEGSVITGIAPAIGEYPRPVLIGLRGDRAENGFRFDLDTFDSSAPTYSWWTDRCSQECVIQTILGTSTNAEFI